jgi:small multidrug resistance family-3 protein
VHLPAIVQVLAFLVAATIVEVSGDAVIRIALYNHPGISAARIGLFVLGAALVIAYSTFLNLAPLEFREVVGLYIATLFIIWQIVNFAFFRTLPTIPVAIGGSLIVVGGIIVSLWKA